MQIRFPGAQTERLILREYRAEDAAVHRALIEEGFGGPYTLEMEQRWLAWTLEGYEEFARLYQPPYVEYAVTLRSTGELIGGVGIVPSIVPWSVFEPQSAAAPERFYNQAEFGLFWVLRTAHRGQGYASEAAQALCDYLFFGQRVTRVIAMTEHDNLASQRVMHKLGMRLLRNPLPEPPWFQVLGVLDHPELRDKAAG